MPKENINCINRDNMRAELYWYGEPGLSHVHLTTANRDLEPEDDGAVPEDYHGFRVDLDAAGIDRLIDALRRAKRKAFPSATAGEVVAAQQACFSARQEATRLVEDAERHLAAVQREYARTLEAGANRSGYAAGEQAVEILPSVRQFHRKLKGT